MAHSSSPGVSFAKHEGATSCSDTRVLGTQQAAGLAETHLCFHHKNAGRLTGTGRGGGVQVPLVIHAVATHLWWACHHREEGRCILISLMYSLFHTRLL